MVNFGLVMEEFCQHAIMSESPPLFDTLDLVVITIVVGVAIWVLLKKCMAGKPQKPPASPIRPKGMSATWTLFACMHVSSI